MAAGVVVVGRERPGVVEAAVAGATAVPRDVPVRSISRSGLRAAAGMRRAELGSWRFRGVRVLGDLSRRVVDLGGPPVMACLRGGWLWVDDGFLDALRGDGPAADAGRAVVRHAAAYASHPGWSAERIRARAPLPDLDPLRSGARPTVPSHSFAPFQDGCGRWGLRVPEYGTRRAPDAVAGVVQVLARTPDGYAVGAGVVVDADDTIWIVTAAHLLHTASRVTVVIAGRGYAAVEAELDRQALARALAAEREPSTGETGEYDPLEAARTLDLTLLRLQRRSYHDPAPVVIPPAAELVDGAAVVTVGYPAHPKARRVVVDLFGYPASDVVVVSTGTLHVGASQEDVPLVLPIGGDVVTARQAGGGPIVAVHDDWWVTGGSSGGPALVETPGRAPGHALAGVAIGAGQRRIRRRRGVHRLDVPGRRTLLADAGAVRAVLAGRRR